MIDWLGRTIYEYYASTESNGLTSIDSEEWLRKRGSVGRSAQGVIHICGESGEELACGEVGTVYFERDEVPFEYHNDPEKTCAAQHPEHSLWTTVGDLGYVDEDGYLFLTDRKSFTMIISGGVNIYPQEVENVLVMHPKVADVAVIGVVQPEMGEEVKAVVQPAEGAEAGPEPRWSSSRTSVSASPTTRRHGLSTSSTHCRERQLASSQKALCDDSYRAGLRTPSERGDCASCLTHRGIR